MPAATLLAILQMIERSAGRRRTGVRWGARTLDLDVLLFGDEVIRTPTLVVPHPGRRLAAVRPRAPRRALPGAGRARHGASTVSRLLALAPPADVVCAGLYPA